jgi:hypothetical protein
LNDAYLEALATHGKGLITHIGLVNASGTPVGDARKAVTWGANDGDGDFLMSANLVFNMSAGQVVAGWRGYSAASGGTDYGGAPLTQVTFGNPGTYTLQASSTGISLSAS